MLNTEHTVRNLLLEIAKTTKHDYKEHKFDDISLAKEKQKLMKKKYGYTPEILKVRKRGTIGWKYIVVEPKRIKKIR